MKSPTLLFGAAALLAASATSLAAQEGVQVFQGARIHPVSGPAVDNGVVIVSGGRIVAVGGSDLETPSGAQIIDCSGKVITPGLVDAGTTIGVAANDKNEQGDEVTPAVRITDAIDPASRDFERALILRALATTGGRRVEAAVLYTQTPQLFALPGERLAAYKSAFAAPQESFALPPVE